MKKHYASEKFQCQVDEWRESWVDRLNVDFTKQTLFLPLLPNPINPILKKFHHISCKSIKKWLHPFPHLPIKTACTFNLWKHENKIFLIYDVCVSQFSAHYSFAWNEEKKLNKMCLSIIYHKLLHATWTMSLFTLIHL